MSELNETIPRYESEKQPLGCMQIGMDVISALLISLLIGISVGILLYLRSLLIYRSSNLSVGINILTLIPLIAAIYASGWGLGNIIKKLLTRAKTKTLSFAVLFSVIVAFIAIFGVFEGITITETFLLILYHQFESVGQIIGTILFTLFAGGVVGASVMLTPQNLSSTNSLIILSTTVFYLWVGIRKVKDTITDCKE